MAAVTESHRLTLREVLDALVADGLVAREQADALAAERRSARAGVHPLVIVADRKWHSLKAPNKPLHLDFLAEWFAGKAGLPHFHIDPLKIDFAKVTGIMSAAYAERFRILAVEVTSREVVIATAEPYQREWEEELARIHKLEVRRVFANPSDISRYIAEFYNLAKSVKRATQAGDKRSELANFEQLVELGNTRTALDANDRHIVNIVDWLWQYAFDQRASDIHVEPRRELGLVRFRIDGVLHTVYQLPMPVIAAMTSRIKILGRMDVVEKRRPQDGRIKTRTADGAEVELRLSTMPTAFGEKLVMRIFDPEVLVQDMSELGLSDEDKVSWDAMVARPHGMILVTGPTGSGKTTTLYSTLKMLATPEVNVCTVEDPIEMIEPGFNQMQVQPQIDLSFAEGIRALMRQDPDIIMVGEIRDRETAEMAIQAALTGHLVLSTLHTNDAASAVTRLLDLGVPAYLLSATLLGIMAQRLVRTLCRECREKVAADAVELKGAWEDLLRPWKAQAPTHFHRAVGCIDCRMTGYRGRVGIYEVMTMSPALRKLIDRNAEIARIRTQAYKEGMKSLRLSGAMKVAAGLTTFEEVLSAAPPHEGGE